VRILISAGEASGEFYGAELIKALRRQAPNPPAMEFFGVGGDQMRSAGCELLVDAREIAEVGIVEVIKHIPNIYRRFHQVVREAQKRRPDAAVLIDFPDFNLRLARELHQQGVPVIYYVSPQLWAWKQRRIERVRNYVREMLVIFPFEEKFYRERGVAATFVGHPLADLPVHPLRARHSPPNTASIPSASGLPCCRAAAVARSPGSFPSCCKQGNFSAPTTFTQYRLLPRSMRAGWHHSCAVTQGRRLLSRAMLAQRCCMHAWPRWPAAPLHWRRL
jgi:lipid A disaccharide synthetase